MIRLPGGERWQAVDYIPLSPSTSPIDALIPAAVRKPLTEYVRACSSSGLRIHRCANSPSLGE